MGTNIRLAKLDMRILFALLALKNKEDKRTKNKNKWFNKFLYLGDCESFITCLLLCYNFYEQDLYNIGLMCQKKKRKKICICLFIHNLIDDSIEWHFVFNIFIPDSLRYIFILFTDKNYVCYVVIFSYKKIGWKFYLEIFLVLPTKKKDK